MTAATAAKLEEEAPQKTRTLWQNAVLHILRDKLTLAAMLGSEVGGVVTQWFISMREPVSPPRLGPQVKSSGLEK